MTKQQFNLFVRLEQAEAQLATSRTELQKAIARQTIEQIYAEMEKEGL